MLILLQIDNKDWVPLQTNPYKSQGHVPIYVQSLGSGSMQAISSNVPFRALRTARPGKFGYCDKALRCNASATANQAL